MVDSWMADCSSLVAFYETSVTFFPPVLQTIDPTRVYVLGGVVDESVDKVTDIIISCWV